MFYRKYILCLTLLFLAGCKAAAPTETPVQTPQVWRLGYSTSMEVFLPELYTCASEQPGVQLIIQESANLSNQEPDELFFFQWGNVDQVSGYAAKIGSDRWVAIVNTRNPIETISIDDLRNLYTSGIKTWAEVSTGNQGFAEQVQVWAYPDSLDIETGFEETLDWDMDTNQNILLAPDPEVMLQSVAITPGAIGFVPASWLNSSVKEITIVDLPDPTRTKPLVVVGSSEPSGQTLDWLFCVQSSIP
jgi:hypothetical protein